jgi:hypothetical protein
MKHLFSNRSIPLLVSVTMATVTLSTLQAESHCPTGIASVTPRFVQRALIVIPVRINQEGPFDFMVDTGSQVTVVDPLLASELQLKPQGTVGLLTDATLGPRDSAMTGRITSKSPAAWYLSFVDTHSPKKQCLMLVQPTGEQNSKDRGRLIFRQYGGSNYLYQVWIPGQGEGRQFVRSRTEQETLRERKSSSLAEVQLPTGPAQQ